LDRVFRRHIAPFKPNTVHLTIFVVSSSH
jgi:hypothetical protein